MSNISDGPCGCSSRGADVVQLVVDRKRRRAHGTIGNLAPTRLVPWLRVGKLTHRSCGGSFCHE